MICNICRLDGLGSKTSYKISEKRKDIVSDLANTYKHSDLFSNSLIGLIALRNSYSDRPELFLNFINQLIANSRRCEFIKRIFKPSVELFVAGRAVNYQVGRISLIIDQLSFEMNKFRNEDELHFLQTCNWEVDQDFEPDSLFNESLNLFQVAFTLSSIYACDRQMFDETPLGRLAKLPYGNLTFLKNNRVLLTYTGYVVIRDRSSGPYGYFAGSMYSMEDFGHLKNSYGYEVIGTWNTFVVDGQYTVTIEGELNQQIYIRWSIINSLEGKQQLKIDFNNSKISCLVDLEKLKLDKQQLLLQQAEQERQTVVNTMLSGIP